MNQDHHDARGIVASFPISGISELASLGEGLIHNTYKAIADEGFFVLQRTTREFDRMLPDIARVTEHLSEKGLNTARVLKTRNGRLSEPQGDYFWRMTTYIEGSTIEREASPQQVRSAAEFAGKLQTGLLDFTCDFEATLPHFHDAEYFFQRLRTLHKNMEGTEKYRRCKPLGYPEQ